MGKNESTEYFTPKGKRHSEISKKLDSTTLWLYRFLDSVAEKLTFYEPSSEGLREVIHDLKKQGFEDEHREEYTDNDTKREMIVYCKENDKRIHIVVFVIMENSDSIYHFKADFAFNEFKEQVIDTLQSDSILRKELK